MRKSYGQSQIHRCPFCGDASTRKSRQGLPTCQHHTDEKIDLRCVCGNRLDVKESKYGTFFLCDDCGPISYAKGLEMNDLPLKSADDL